MGIDATAPHPFGTTLFSPYGHRRQRRFCRAHAHSAAWWRGAMPVLGVIGKWHAARRSGAISRSGGIARWHISSARLQRP